MSSGFNGTNQACASLVALRLPRIAGSTQLDTPVLFITISPKPTVMVDTIRKSELKNRKIKVPYKLLPEQEKYYYCLKIIRDCYLEWLTKPYELVGTWELNKSGHLHVHFLLCSPELKTEYDIRLLRNHVSSCNEVIKNMSSKRNAKDYMNNIVYVDRDISEVIEYMDKDHEMRDRYYVRMPNYYVN